MSDQDLRESVVRQFRAAADSYQISQIGPGDARAIADLLEAPQPVVDREAILDVITDFTREDEEFALQHASALADAILALLTGSAK